MWHTNILRTILRPKEGYKSQIDTFNSTSSKKHIASLQWSRQCTGSQFTYLRAPRSSFALDGSACGYFPNRNWRFRPYTDLVFCWHAQIPCGFPHIKTESRVFGLDKATLSSMRPGPKYGILTLCGAICILHRISEIRGHKCGGRCLSFK